MSDIPGVFTTYRKDGTQYYRVSITYRNKHISLGSFDDSPKAAKVYREADLLLHSESSGNLAEPALYYHPDKCSIPFEKWIILVNFRDNGLYFKTPIYIFHKYFLYYLAPDRCLKFDVDDLFYYSTRKIMIRGRHLFVNDYGMQVSVLSRYGIRSHAVCGRDYIFVNGDCDDFRYGNIHIINQYYGVRKIIKNARTMYKAIIHIHGNFVVGTYPDEKEAAIAYNKAARLLEGKGIIKAYPSNYIDDISQIEYARIYNSVRISKKLIDM